VSQRGLCRLEKKVPNLKHSSHIGDNSKCAVIVAHPDDETLWAGGLMLMHPGVKWTVATICRKSDADRAPKFFKALEEFGAVGYMGDLDDGPEQEPLDSKEIHRTILGLLPLGKFEVIITHSTTGEYTRHLRHEETGHAVMRLWKAGELNAGQVWSFAYEDGGQKYLPRANKGADLQIRLPDIIWQRKYDIITKIYGFGEDSFEAKTTPRQEAFWRFGSVGKK
jgi:LmbE family N-acetylglucosaminyl deacetylase